MATQQTAAEKEAAMARAAELLAGVTCGGFDFESDPASVSGTDFARAAAPDDRAAIGTNDFAKWSDR